MRNLSAYGWKLTLALLCATPLGLLAQEVPPGGNPNQNDNTGFGTASAEFLLLGAGARGTALGGAFAAIATDISSLYYNPAGAAMIDGPASCWEPGLHRRHPLFLGWCGVPVLGRVAHRRLPDRDIRVQGPAGVHRGAADGTGGTYL